MVPRITTGIHELDQILEGGYPKGSIISIYGTTSNLRKRLCFSFLQHNDTTSEKRQIYITTKDPVDRIMHEISLNNLVLDNLIFLDAVNWRNKRVNPNTESKAEFSVNNLTDLNSLLAKIMEICKLYRIDRIVFDSPTSLLLYSTPGKEQVFKFFELLTAFIRTNQMNLIFTLEEGVLNEQIVSTMHYLSDGALKISKNDNSRYEIEVLNMTMTQMNVHCIELSI